MPQKVTCKECNYVLYESRDEGGDLKSPEDIIRMYFKEHDGKCPKCARYLGPAVGVGIADKEPVEVDLSEAIKKYKRIELGNYSYVDS